MALCPSSSILVCEKDCLEIRTTLGCPSRLSPALAHRSRAERRRIRETYGAMYGEDLVARLNEARAVNPKKELCNMLYLWMLEPHESDAMVARDVIDSIATDYGPLVEIYTCRKSSQLFLINQAYLARFKRSLDQDIISLPSNSYQKILVALGTSHRSHHVEVSKHVAKCDAKRLYEAGKGITGPVDESTILEMFSKRSIPQLRLTLSSYRRIYGRSFTKALKESCREFEGSVRVVLKCMNDPHKYYSKMLHKSMNGHETDEKLLSRLAVRAADLGLEEIKADFVEKYGLKLEDAVCKSISTGDYREFIVALISKQTS